MILGGGLILVSEVPLYLICEHTDGTDGPLVLEGEGPRTPCGLHSVGGLDTVLQHPGHPLLFLASNNSISRTSAINRGTSLIRNTHPRRITIRPSR